MGMHQDAGSQHRAVRRHHIPFIGIVFPTRIRVANGDAEFEAARLLSRDLHRDNIGFPRQGVARPCERECQGAGDADPAQRRLFAALTTDPTSLAEITRRAGLPAPRAMAALALLAITGQICELPGQRYKLREGDERSEEPGSGEGATFCESKRRDRATAGGEKRKAPR